KYILCNSDESEPGTCKDRDILRYNPHSVVEGMAIACYATGSTAAYNYLRGEFHHEPFEHFEQALADAYKHGWLGKNVLGSGCDIDIYGALGAGAYICGVTSRRSRPTSACTASRPRSTTPRPMRRCRRSSATARSGSRI
ncbi:MAG: hypothetical protein RSH52_34410, partial [Janthinobacterium sp.]